MKISKEAREAAADYILADGIARESDVRKFRQGFRDDDELVQVMQSLINSTLDRAAGVAKERANESSAHPEWNMACWEVEAAILALKEGTQ